MKKNELISHVAKRLHIAPSSIRYWEEAGLIHFERDQENNYRQFTIETLNELADLVFYRKLALSVKTILKLSSENIDDFEQYLVQEKANVNEQIAQSKIVIDRINHKLTMIEKLQSLQATNFVVEAKQFETIYPFQFDNENHVQSYLADPYQTVVLMKNANPFSVSCGILKERSSEKPKLRVADSKIQTYLRGVLKIETADLKKNNSWKFKEEAKKQGFITGDLIGKHLLSASKGAKYNYYEGWLEVFPFKNTLI